MKIKLAGYNVDADMLGDALQHDAVTPETLSAAYARISRSPDPVDVLRRKACEDVAEARKSNDKIVFEYGHKSIAEHAVLNFDIMGASRLAVEAIEHSRLCSYTEKSQRYLNIEDGEVVVPLELGGRQLERYTDTVSAQTQAYHELMKALKNDPGRSKGKPEEDARYVTPLGMEAQLGMTLNARSLEEMICRLKAHPLQEVCDIGEALFDEAKKIIPSLLRYCDPRPIRYKAFNDLAKQFKIDMINPSAPGVIVFCGENIDRNILASLIYTVSKASIRSCIALGDKLTEEQAWELFKTIYQFLDVHDAVPRPFELEEVTFEAVMSASCFAQMKRHRMATLIPQDYDPNLGYVIPEAVKRTGQEALFDSVMQLSEDTYSFLKGATNNPVAEYVLTQAHKRRVFIKMNFRELYAFARLRMDGHAQWEIRELATDTIETLRKNAPMTLALACGKDAFDGMKDAALNRSFDEHI